MHIKIYRLDSIVKFGRYCDQSIRNILEIEPDYITWCVGHLDHFSVSEEVIELLVEKYPTFMISENLKAIINKKAETFKAQDYCDNDDKPSYGKYSGSYAQNVEGLSDDFIDDGLDGFADAYWNID